jgi:hypothetical protein
VPIRPFLPDSQSFDPEDIANMSAAFEAALGKLGLVDRSDPAAMAVAKLIIEIAKGAIAIRSGCARWRCSNYQSEPAQEPLGGQTYFLRRSPKCVSPPIRHKGSRNPALP